MLFLYYIIVNKRLQNTRTVVLSNRREEGFTDLHGENNDYKKISFSRFQKKVTIMQDIDDIQSSSTADTLKQVYAITVKDEEKNVIGKLGDILSLYQRRELSDWISDCRKQRKFKTMMHYSGKTSPQRLSLSQIQIVNPPTTLKQLANLLSSHRKEFVREIVEHSTPPLYNIILQINDKPGQQVILGDKIVWWNTEQDPTEEQKQLLLFHEKMMKELVAMFTEMKLYRFCSFSASPDKVLIQHGFAFWNQANKEKKEKKEEEKE